MKQNALSAIFWLLLKTTDSESQFSSFCSRKYDKLHCEFLSTFTLSEHSLIFMGLLNPNIYAVYGLFDVWGRHSSKRKLEHIQKKTNQFFHWSINHNILQQNISSWIWLSYFQNSRKVAPLNQLFQKIRIVLRNPSFNYYIIHAFQNCILLISCIPMNFHEKTQFFLIYLLRLKTKFEVSL